MRHVLTICDYQLYAPRPSGVILKIRSAIHAASTRVGSERKTIYYLSVRRVPDYAASAGTVTSAAITALFS